MLYIIMIKIIYATSQVIVDLGYFRDLEKLEQLQELNVSSNLLTYLPSCLGRHPRLQVVRANCNLLQELPSFKNSSALKVRSVESIYI